jgi:hypothetical protein
MTRALWMAMAVVVASAFTMRAEEPVAAAPAKPEAKAACAVTKGCPACAACKDAGSVCAACMTRKCHVLAVKDGKAQCCACPKDCKCTVKEGDTKCSCGKDVQSCDLKGKFVCDCGADCTCNRIAAKPGKCGCGKEMKEVK